MTQLDTRTTGQVEREMMMEPITDALLERLREVHHHPRYDLDTLSLLEEDPS